MKYTSMKSTLLSLSVAIVQHVCADPVMPPPLHTAPVSTGTVALAAHAAAHENAAVVKAQTLIIKHSDGARRMKHRQPTMICIEGFKINQANGKCEKNDVVDASVGCPSGWDLLDGTCETSFVDPAGLGCPPGYQRTPKGCIREYDAPMNMFCPPHYNATAEGCVKDVETTPTWSCDAGELNGDTCEIAKLTAELIQCSSGYTRLDHTNNCIRTRERKAQKTCPLSYELREGQCHKLLRKPVIKRCPNGNITEDGVCIATSIFPMPSSCPPNTLDEGGKCKKTRSQDAASICPVGTEEAGPVCLKYETQPVEMACPGGMSKPNKNGTCPGKEPAVKQCPGGWIFKDKSSCVKKSVVQRVAKCPVGMELVGDHCSAEEYLQHVLKCPTGTRQLDDHSCAMETRKQVELVCEAPYVFIEASQDCLFSNVIDAEFECVEGYFDEAKNMCVIAEVEAATVGCPHGAVKIHSGPNPVCREFVYTKAKPSCPVDFILKEDDTCRGQAVIPGRLGCEMPFEERNGTCVIVEKRMIEPHCDEGVLKGSSCVTKKQQPPAILCPETYTYKLGSRLCEKFLWADPIVDCDGWLYDRKVKECYTYEGSESWEAAARAEARSSPSNPSVPIGPNEPSGVVPSTSTFTSETPVTTRPSEKLLPLEVHATTSTTPKTVGTVKAKVQQPRAGKENFVPIQTFTGPNAVTQAQQYELLKLQGHAAQPVFAPQTTYSH